ncbi:site-specific integrase [Enterovibrio sp. ZSDZ42]|uniref:Site-specific integrase n=1 Tax=Enterovibrio gelatinilyticus TaxID=2899819 RepID=A0ABT5R7L8_9GAMM|nr:site-specific integrase [Enterovibrio sp. ZSDZ42]MDD1796269.1 site-specific integrase [Enterovibrio sp. ZSDZ42]
MVFVVKSSSIEVPRIHPYSSSETPILLKGYPTFYSSDYQYLMPVNLWMNYLVNGRKSKDLNSAVRALKRYWSFLEKNELDWDVFPKSKFLRPTYRFRNDDLLANARAGNIRFSTASLYMLHVIKFYEWCIANQVLDLSEDEKPFEYELVKVRNQGMMSHLRPHFLVTSTDLRIRIPKKADIQSLNPLTRDELAYFGRALSHFGIEFIIHQLLQIHSGLRIEEACTFPLSTAIEELGTLSYSEVNIGPVNGVATKYGKERKVEIPSKLAAMINAYANSNRRKKRLKGKESAFLLVTKNGTRFTSNNVHQSFRRLKERIQEESGNPFNHKSHDLRATYCTYRLSSLLEHGLQKDAVLQMMAWMGHNNETTTWKYVDYLEREKTVQSATSLLDKILEEAIYEEA